MFQPVVPAANRFRLVTDLANTLREEGEIDESDYD
jgi:hypothetical protein